MVKYNVFSDGCISQLKSYTILLLSSFGVGVGVGGSSSVFLSSAFLSSVFFLAK